MWFSTINLLVVGFGLLAICFWLMSMKLNDLRDKVKFLESRSRYLLDNQIKDSKNLHELIRQPRVFHISDSKVLIRQDGKLKKVKNENIILSDKEEIPQYDPVKFRTDGRGDESLEYKILEILHSSRANHNNVNNDPVPLSYIVRWSKSDSETVLRCLLALKSFAPPYVVERYKFNGERSFSISNFGMIYFEGKKK